jgi:hypothetical protein
VIYFWECTSPVRVCILLNAIIFFFASTVAFCGILYIPNLYNMLFRKKALSKKSSIPLTTNGNPKRTELSYQIGIEIQKFHEKFKPFKYNQRLKDRYVEYENVKEAFKPLENELLFQANLTLSNTPIPKSIIDLQREITKCGMRLGDMSSQLEERQGYINGKEQPPRDLIYRIDVTYQSFDEIINKIDFLIDQIIESCKEIT